MKSITPIRSDAVSAPCLCRAWWLYFADHPRRGLLIGAILLLFLLAATSSGCDADSSRSASAVPVATHQTDSTPVIDDAQYAMAATATAATDHDHGHAHDHAHPHTHPGETQLAHAAFHPSFDPSAPCTCAAAIEQNTWCKKCNVGYVAGVKIESSRLFESIDAHGHVLDLNRLTCESCQRAIANDEFCGACRMGFVRKLAYFTRLTHGVARGTVVNPNGISCSTCASFIGKTGWCDGCARGIVGNVMLREKDVFTSTAREFRTLHLAIAKTKFCEGCAATMMLHTTCPYCLISYETLDFIDSSATDDT